MHHLLQLLQAGSLEKGLAAYKEAGIDAHGYVADVTDEDAVNAMVAKIKAEVGPVDILVNNAGLMKRIPMIEMSHCRSLRVIDVHVGGAFNVAKAVIPDMIAKRGGKIINICSMMSELGRETVSAYAAAKGGSEDADQEHRFRVRRVQHPVQRHGPRLHRHRPDRAPARDPAGRQPSSLRPVHLSPRPPQAAGATPRTWSAPRLPGSHASDFVNGQILYADGGILAYIGKQAAHTAAPEEMPTSTPSLCRSACRWRRRRRSPRG